MSHDASLAPSTLAIAAGRPERVPGAPVNEPVILTSTYVANGERSYARAANPTWEAFEATIGALERGTAVAFASGMAAIAAVLDAVPLGGRVVVPSRVYSGTLALLEAETTRGRLTVDLVDIDEPGALATASINASMVWLESPTNPTMEVIDLRAAIAGAHAAGAVAVVDNTFATPLVQQPLDLGADLVLHSASKFLAGHSDVILGVAISRSPELLSDLRTQRELRGAVPGPMEVFLALRGVRTLAVRLRQSQESALVIAQRLAAHPRVARARYPGLTSDPGHEIARTQMSGFGAMLAFEHAAGAEAAESTCGRTRLWTHATSLGGVESTLERRRRWEFEPDSVPDSLVRLSVGCEDVEDLWADLDQAL